MEDQNKKSIVVGDGEEHSTLLSSVSYEELESIRETNIKSFKELQDEIINIENLVANKKNQVLALSGAIRQLNDIINKIS